MPCSSESVTRTLVQSSTGGKVKLVAQLGAPADASTMFTPIDRSSVLLPDMFEPVTSRKVPLGPTVRSLQTRDVSGISGWPSRSAVIAPCVALTAPNDQPGLSWE